MKVGVAIIEALNQQLIYGDFDLELQDFKRRMMVQVVRILMHFCHFQWLIIIQRPTPFQRSFLAFIIRT
jgi:hypothetical protein